jgi:hypothetical protein
MELVGRVSVDTSRLGVGLRGLDDLWTRLSGLLGVLVFLSRKVQV